MSYTAAKVLELIDEAALEPSEVDRLLAPLGISSSDLRDAGRTFRMDEILNIFSILAENARDRFAAYRAGRKMRMAHLGVFGLALMSQPDLRTALDFVLKYRALSSPMIGLGVEIGEQESRLIFSPIHAINPADAGYPRLLDFNFGLVSALIEDGLGRTDAISAIHLSGLADDMTRKALESSGFRIVAGASQDAMVFANAVMSAPLRYRNPIGAAIALKLCDQAMAETPAMFGIVGRTRAILIANAQKPITAAVVARELNVSERSLRRQLALDGANFRDLKHQVQGDLARKFLTQTRMTAEDIAEATGFSDVANFRRFFRRNFGLSPGAFRHAKRSDRYLGRK
ncbi:MAG: AraC family transcriptional regulator ligand-binding domain-containing protein [Hyphomicrobiales bacterium]|nr:AraC family transcriptional regulator ligand-binding domain-containing protein [Hyphomicrobiales bacterium]